MGMALGRGGAVGGRIARARRWVDRNYRLGLWVAGLSGYVAGIEAAPLPTAAKVGLMAAGTLFGGSEMIVNLINNRDRDREMEEMRRGRAADAEEKAKLREENAKREQMWREENAKRDQMQQEERAQWREAYDRVSKENVMLREERAQRQEERAQRRRERRGRYRRSRGAGLNGGGGGE